MHTLAFNETLRGLNAEELRYAILSPGTDVAFIDDARKRFATDSAYLDDKPGAPLRFLAEANLTQIIRREETNTDRDEARTRLNSFIRDLFAGTNLNLIPFASGPHDVPDDELSTTWSRKSFCTRGVEATGATTGTISSSCWQTRPGCPT
jgi:GTP-dependent phosphoenolpyruvate carboxykinase